MDAPVPNSPLMRIRKGKRVEPLNTGDNHPKKIYTILGHGEEEVGEKHTVPKGCILVVKSHSGDNVKIIDSNHNTINLLNPNNKEAVFDPVSHKRELFEIFAADIQGATAGHSSAIYREGDTYNNFTYQLVNPNRFGGLFNSGIYALEYTDTSDTPQRLAYDIKNIQSPELDNSTRVFEQGEDGLYTFNPLLVPAKQAAKLAIEVAAAKLQLDEYILNKMPSFSIDFMKGRYEHLKARMDKLDPEDNNIFITSKFKYSNAYEYYYTKQHIDDICTVILAIVNLLNGNSDFEMDNEHIYTALEDQLGDTKKPLLKKIVTWSERPEFKKGVMANIVTDDVFNYLINSIIDYGSSHSNESESNESESNNAGFDKLNNMNVAGLILELIKCTKTTQADLFKDIENGLLTPGVFYNLVCRATSAKRNNSRGLHNPKINGPIRVKNISGELKNRISESELQRKNQIRKVMRIHPAFRARAADTRQMMAEQAQAWLAKAEAATGRAGPVSGKGTGGSRTTQKRRKYRKRKTRGNK